MRGHFVGTACLAVVVFPLGPACQGSDPPCEGAGCGIDAGATVDSGGTCSGSDECDDGLFCNGPEVCVDGVCEAGAAPCGAEDCDDEGDVCSGPCAEPDADGDGYDAISCDGDDCDDSDRNRFPGNPEVCDDLGRDEDCNLMTLGPDNDGDGYVSTDCANTLADGSEARGQDCDDRNASVNPDGTESCNGADDDCDGEVDEGVLLTYYRDADGDGYGVSDETALGCTLPDGWAFNPGDCDDMAPARHPGAAEVCADGIDNDCNGVVDDAEGCECTVAGDTEACGGGPVNVDPAICRRGSHTCLSGGTWSDCTGSTDPVPETCNAVDDDCDGVVDEGGSRQCVLGETRSCTVCRLLLGRVYGTQTCGSTCTWGRCEPDADDTCNAVDDDCDGDTDEDFVEGIVSPCRDGVYRFYRNDTDTIYHAADVYLHTDPTATSSPWTLSPTGPLFYDYHAMKSGLVELRRCRRSTSPRNYTVIAAACPSGFDPNGSVGYVWSADSMLLAQVIGAPLSGMSPLYALYKGNIVMYTIDIGEYDRFLANGWSPLDNSSRWGTACGFWDPSRGSSGSFRDDLCAVAGVWRRDV